MQGHHAHTERLCNLTLQLALGRQVTRLRELDSDFRLRVLSLFGHRTFLV
jgi:hypothetical protein